MLGPWTQPTHLKVRCFRKEAEYQVFLGQQELNVFISVSGTPLGTENTVSLTSAHAQLPFQWAETDGNRQPAYRAGHNVVIDVEQNAQGSGKLI